MSQDTFTLAAVSALEGGSPQSNADISQSVYNREQDGTYGSSITNILTTKGQYQVTFVDPTASSGSGTNVASIWKKITDEDSAVAAMSYYYQQRNITKSESTIRQEFRSSLSAIQNPTLQQNARNFVGNRTEFLSARSNAPAGSITRGSAADNQYFIRYGSAKNKAGQNSPAPIPASISSSSPTSSPTSSSELPNTNTYVYIPEPIKIYKPSVLSPETLNIQNALLAQRDVIAKFVKDNEGTAESLLSDELKEEYNNEKNKFDELQERLTQLAETDPSATCFFNDMIGKSASYPGAPDCTQLQKSIAYQKAVSDLSKPVDLPDPCGKSDLSKINTTLLKFFNDLKAIRQFGDTYINSAYNEIYRVTNLVRNTASTIGAVLKGIMQNLRNWLLDKIRRGIQDLIDIIFPTLAKQLKNTIIGQIIDNVLCKFKDVIKNLGSLVGDFLFELIGKVVNAPLCAVQQFTNGLINNVVAKVDEALGPILDSINDLLGGAGKIVGSVFEALDFILGFEAYLCQKPNCPEIKSTILGPWANSPNKPFEMGLIILLVNAEKDFSEEGIQKYVNGLSIFGGTLGDLQMLLQHHSHVIQIHSNVVHLVLKFLVAVALVPLERQLLMISDKFMV